MLYAYIPENIENLDLSQNFSINELQTLKKIGSAADGAHFCRAGQQPIFSFLSQRHMVTLPHGNAWMFVPEVEPSTIGVNPRILVTFRVKDVPPRAFGCSLI